MARSCPTCATRYEQEDIRFCLHDGAVLVEAGAPLRLVAGGGVTGPSSAYQATLPPSSGDTNVEPGTNVELPVVHADALPPGAKVGEYVIERKIGEGGMGMIFSAVHPIIGKKVAIKVLFPQMASNPDVVSRFVQEAKSVNQIRHRNIVDIFSFGNLADGRHYFAMELLEGESMSDRLKQGAMPWNEAVSVWIQLASAVEAAHQHGIVHRDLKPDNVFLCPSAEGAFVKVLDFGIAKLLGDAPMGMTKTSTGMPIGTPAYMAPEQAVGAKVDHRTDLYSYGIILYESVSGRPPFTGDTLIQLLNAQMNEPPPDLSSLAATVHPELRALVHKLLEKDPAARPQHMSEVREELVRLRDLALAERVPLYGDAMPPTAPRRTTARAAVKKGLPLPLVAGVAVGAIVAAAAVVQLTRKPAPPLVAPPPVAAPAPAPAVPKAGRLLVSTNAMATRVYLDPSGGERSAQPAAAGGNNLRVSVPPGVDFVLRVEADGYQAFTLPLKLAADEEKALPVVLTAVAPAPVAPAPAAHRSRSSKPAAASAPAVTKKPEAPRSTDNGKFLDPFAN